MGLSVAPLQSPVGTCRSNKGDPLNINIVRKLKNHARRNDHPATKHRELYSSKYNLQDATLYKILSYCQCSTCFGRFLRPLSGAQELYTQHLVCARLAAATASVVEMEFG
jgi:hypothetical protein